MIYDFCIIGSGIVGASVAYNLKLKAPKAKILIIDKESQAGFHQTGHNSGVIHAGIYYEPNSLKSNFCISGLNQTYQFCDKYQVPYKKVGKLIVANNEQEHQILEGLKSRLNGKNLNLNLIGKNTLKKIEPNLKSSSALFSPNTGVINWLLFSKKLLELFHSNNGKSLLKTKVTAIEESDKFVTLNCKNDSGSNIKILTKKLVVCGGLQADRLAKLSGVEVDFQIIPFRGDFYKLDTKFNKIFNHLIYPTPSDKLPFLGIHFTKTIDDQIIIGPNASLNFSREGYGKLDTNLNDIIDYIKFQGFWKLLFKNKEFIFHELLTSIFKRYYFNECMKYTTMFEINNFKYFKSGIRAQLVDKNGSLVNDFYFKETNKILHVINAPSPAATSSLPIGDYISRKIIN
jgi:L-2-hydroxyglutarate oxidase